MKSITIVVAMARNGAIGQGGRMPWHLLADLANFKQTTMGKPIIMGRKTFESIGKALPGRQNIVVSHNPDYQAECCDIADSLDQAVDIAIGLELMVIGGGQLYRQALRVAQRMLVTQVDCEPEADTWFPQLDLAEWEERSRTSFAADEHNEFNFELIEYLRR